jgi:hypothetical protein
MRCACGGQLTLILDEVMGQTYVCIDCDTPYEVNFR